MFASVNASSSSSSSSSSSLNRDIPLKSHCLEGGGKDEYSSMLTDTILILKLILVHNRKRMDFNKAQMVYKATVFIAITRGIWGRSFCRTIEKLVEVVQEYPSEVEHIYSPSCVPLVRCAGCCGDENLECHPTQTTNVTMQLLKIRPSEQGQEYVEMTFVEHQTCEFIDKYAKYKPRLLECCSNRGKLEYKLFLLFIAVKTSCKPSKSFFIRFQA
uniref:Placental growth factor b n=1 Tax=Neolamprologus brichardi TaxID=32507 RepID=A0A3Q4GJR2_NEOBR